MVSLKKVQRYKSQSDNVSECEHKRTICLYQGPSETRDPEPTLI